MVKQFAERYQAPLEFGQDVIQALRDRCTQRENGARMLDAGIEGELLPPLSLQALSHVAGGAAMHKATLSYDGEQFHATTE